MLKKKVSKNILVKFIVPYILVILISAIIGLIIYSTTIKIVEDEIVSVNRLSLEQINTVLEQNIIEIDDMVFRITNDSEIKSFRYIDSPFDKDKINRIYNISNKMKNYKIYKELVLDYSIIFNENETVITPNSIYRKDSYFEIYFAESNISKEDFFKSVFNVKSRDYIAYDDVLLNLGTFDTVAYIHHMGQTKSYEDYLVFYLNKEYILNLFSGIDLSDGGYLRISDRYGNLLMLISENEENSKIYLKLDEKLALDLIDEKKMITTSIFSEKMGWEYLVVQPNHIVKAKIIKIKSILYICLLIYLLAGIFYSFVIARRNSRPVQHIMEKIRQKNLSIDSHKGNKNIYNVLDSYFENLINDNDLLASRLDEQLPIIQSNYFENLIKGNIKSINQALELAKHIQIDIKANNYAIAIVQFVNKEKYFIDNKLQELDIQQIAITDLLNKYLCNRKYVHQSELGKLVIFNFYKEKEKSKCLKKMKEDFNGILNEVFTTIDVSIGVSTIYDSIIDLSRAYEEAEQAVTHLELHQKNSILFFENMRKNNNVYYYPNDTDLKLNNYVIAKDKDAIVDLFNEIYDENFIKRQLSISMIQLFISNIYSSLIKNIQKLSILDEDFINKINKEIENVFDLNTRNSFYDNEKIISYYVDLSSLVQKKKNSHNEKLIVEIKEYIEKFYNDKQFSLYKLSEEFNMAEVYLSQYFKEHTGENYSDYLKKIRMEAASKLLVESEMNISQVSDYIGYSSVSAFSRAFRQFYGVSASIYKNSNKRR